MRATYTRAFTTQQANMSKRIRRALKIRVVEDTVEALLRHLELATPDCLLRFQAAYADTPSSSLSAVQGWSDARRELQSDEGFLAYMQIVASVSSRVCCARDFCPFSFTTSQRI